jgi:hypothetical protein
LLQGVIFFSFVYADFVDDEVLPLAQDKWLLDSYLNASGRIRYFTLPAHLLKLNGETSFLNDPCTDIDIDWGRSSWIWTLSPGQ